MGESDEDRVGLLHQLAQSRTASRKRTHQHASPRRRHPASQSTRRRSPNNGPHDSHSKNRHAEIQSPPSSRPPTTKPRSRHSMLRSRRQLNLHRRKATNHAKSPTKRRRIPTPRSRPKPRTTSVPAGSVCRPGAGLPLQSRHGTAPRLSARSILGAGLFSPARFSRARCLIATLSPTPTT